MAEQAIDVPFIAGRGDDIDERLAPAGVLRVALNVEPTKTGRFAKRKGLEYLPRATPLHGNLDGGVARVYDHRGTLCALQQHHRDLGVNKSITVKHTSWSPSHQGWILARSNNLINSTYGDGPLPLAGRCESRILRRVRVSGDGLTSRDVIPYAATCASGGVEVVAYQAGDGQCRIDIYDATTAGLIASRLVGADVSMVRAWQWGSSSGVIGVGWLNTTSLCLEYVQVTVTDTAPLASLSAVVTTTLEASATGEKLRWDVAGFGSGNAVFAIGNPASDCVQVITAGGTVVAPDTDCAAEWSVAVGAFGASVAVLYTADPGTRELRCAIYTADGASLTLDADEQVDEVASADCYHMAVGFGRPVGGTGPTDYAIGLWSEAGAIPGAVESTRVFDFARTATPADRGYIYGVHPCSAVFCDGQTPLVWLVQNTTASLQRARYLYSLEVPYAVAARVAWGTAWEPAVSYPHPRPTLAADGMWLAAWNEITSGPIASTMAADGYSIVAHRLDTTSRARGLVSSDGAASIIACASSAHYDGLRVAEVGWYEWPPTPTYSTAAGTVPAGSYSYVVVYEETDANGDLHQSAPSLPVSAALADALDVTVSARAAYHTRRTVASARIALYRTTDNGTLYYRVGSVPALDPSVAATIVDTLTDTQLTAREPLRYSAGVVEPFAPPPAEGTCQHGSRTWLACGDRAYYSHERLAGWATEFCAAHYVQAAGAITGLATTGDALLLLTDADAWQVWGQGPDRLGTGEFSPPQYAGGTGCPRELGGARSVASTRAGVVWRARDGIALLPRGATQAQIISAGIEDELLAHPVVAYVVDDEAAQCVRFGLVASDVGTASSREAQWWYGSETPLWTTSSHAVPGRHTGAVVGSRLVIGIGEQNTSGSTAGVYRQRDGYADDTGVTPGAIAMQVATRGLYPAGRNAEGRVRKIAIDGERVVTAGTTLVVQGYHDGTAASARTVLVDGTGELSLQYDCQVQRCTSVAIELLEVSSTAGVELAGITIMAEPLRVDRRRGAAWRV